MNEREMPTSAKLGMQEVKLLNQFPVNSHFQIGIYEGTISPLDIVIKYKQSINGEWTRPRTPKHIHWAVDILIKQNEDPKETDKFLDFLISQWNKTTPFKSEEDRKNFLDTEKLMNEVESESQEYSALAEKGEFSIKFLILLAKLLMVQEKTNRSDVYMFGKVIEQLKNHAGIYKVVSSATFH